MEANQTIPDGIYYIVLADWVGSTKFSAKMGNTALAARIHTFVDAATKALEHAKMSSNSASFSRRWQTES